MCLCVFEIQYVVLCIMKFTKCLLCPGSLQRPACHPLVVLWSEVCHSFYQLVSMLQDVWYWGLHKGDQQQSTVQAGEGVTDLPNSSMLSIFSI